MVNLDGLGVREDQLIIFWVHQTEKVKIHCHAIGASKFELVKDEFP